jgi:YHS domain-containing protein
MSHPAAKGWRTDFVLRKLTLLMTTLLFVGLVALRVWKYSQRTPAMPRPVAENQQRELHLKPGGLYTLADIAANGRTTPIQKYRSFQPQHDFNPQAGDPLCPVTRTKANANCTWTIAGQEYQFCCPPCIDEFVRLAKHRPLEIQPPGAYRKQ